MSEPAELSPQHLAWASTLAAELAEASAAAAAMVGRDPLGLRAVDTAGGLRRYLVAFPGPGFVCLAPDLTAEREASVAHEVAASGVMWEHLEGLLDPAALRYFVAAGGRLLALGDEPAAMYEALQDVGQRTLDLIGWRESPQREVASLAALDAACLLHEGVRTAYGRYVAASEPLVGRQDELAPELVSALRVYEEAAGRAGLGVPLAGRLGEAAEDSHEAADQVVALHLTALR